eukprot:scaffold2621_cov31-Tisochrysis_lutea.AAC.10
MVSRQGAGGARRDAERHAIERWEAGEALMSALQAEPAADKRVDGLSEQWPPLCWPRLAGAATPAVAIACCASSTERAAASASPTGTRSVSRWRRRAAISSSASESSSASSRSPSSFQWRHSWRGEKGGGARSIVCHVLDGNRADPHDREANPSKLTRAAPSLEHETTKRSSYEKASAATGAACPPYHRWPASGSVTGQRKSCKAPVEFPARITSPSGERASEIIAPPQSNERAAITPAFEVALPIRPPTSPAAPHALKQLKVSQSTSRAAVASTRRRDGTSQKRTSPAAVEVRILAESVAQSMAAMATRSGTGMGCVPASACANTPAEGVRVAGLSAAACKLAIGAQPVATSNKCSVPETAPTAKSRPLGEKATLVPPSACASPPPRRSRALPRLPNVASASLPREPASMPRARFHRRMRTGGPISGPSRPSRKPWHIATLAGAWPRHARGRSSVLYGCA